MIKAEFTQANLNKIKQLERQAYAGTPYMQMQHCRSWDDIASYCQCSLSHLHILMSDTGYVIVATHDKGYAEIVDLASTDRRMNLYEVWDFLKSLNLPFTLDARESTSKRMIDKLVEKGEITVVEEDSYTWGGETFYDLKIIPRGVKLTEEVEQYLGRI